VGRPKHLLLQAVGRFDYLTADQLTRLVYGSKVLNYVRDHLKELYQDRYLERLYLYPDFDDPSASPYGSPLAVYCLASKGIAYLRKMGGTFPQRFNPSEQARRNNRFLRHTIEANDLLIQCHALARCDSTSQLVSFTTERELKRNPGVTRLNGKLVKVIPDGWAHISRLWPGRTTPNHHYICWELDRGSIEQEAFRKKIRYLIAWLENGYIDRFQTTSVNLAFLTTDSPQRVDDMIHWTEAEMGQSRRIDYAPFFLFSNFQQDKVHPFHVFLEKTWQQPFSDSAVSLLAPPE